MLVNNSNNAKIKKEKKVVSLYRTVSCSKQKIIKKGKIIVCVHVNRNKKWLECKKFDFVILF